ncbi:putative uracil-DNA glycosylase, uracil DNA glycosylase family 2 [Septoria linicola]|nr:putative uracil-DNA glycosylase, uracil DNA glycosylase family 2 [Septoria linicola]
MMNNEDGHSAGNNESSIDDINDIDSVADNASKPPAHEAFKNSLERFRHTRSTTRKLDTSGGEAETKATRAGQIPSKRKSDVLDDSPSRCTTSSPTKRQRKSSQYAPPSKYAHLSPLTDILEPNLICVFVGFNPGVMTATSGHAYAHPSNSFWKLLRSSGCTDVRLKPEQDVDLPRLYSMGNTNIVARPSKNAGELSKAESAEGTPILEEKIRSFRPEAVCIVGKGIWESIWRWRYKRPIKKDEFKYGWQHEKENMGIADDWPGAKVFVATATSGLAANLKPPEKEAIWLPFGQWVKQRRIDRGDVQKADGPAEA